MSKHLQIFADQTAYNAGEHDYPNVSYITSGNSLVYAVSATPVVQGSWSALTTDFDTNIYFTKLRFNKTALVDIGAGMTVGSNGKVWMQDEEGISYAFDYDYNGDDYMVGKFQDENYTDLKVLTDGEGNCASGADFSDDTYCGIDLPDPLHYSSMEGDYLEYCLPYTEVFIPDA